MQKRKQARRYICEKCTKEISTLAKTRHDRSCDGSYKDYSLKSTRCDFCEKEYSTASGCSNHRLQCALNPDRIKRRTNTAWNKGKSKHTDIRIFQLAENQKRKYQTKELKLQGCFSPEYHKSENHKINSSKGGDTEKTLAEVKNLRFLIVLEKL